MSRPLGLSHAVRCVAQDCPNVLLTMAAWPPGVHYVCSSHRLAWRLSRRPEHAHRPDGAYTAPQLYRTDDEVKP